MSEFGRLKSVSVSVAALLCVLTLVGCPPVQKPNITGADLSEIPATIPTELTITGTGFAQGAVVVFASDELGEIGEVSASSVAANGTSLTVITPTADIESDLTDVTLEVVNPSGRTSGEVDGPDYAAPPILTSVFPTEVPAQVPTQIALTGLNLDPGAEVCFLNNVGSFGCDDLSGTQTVETATLAGTVGPSLVSIKITNDDGQVDTLTGALLYEAAPTVLNVRPELVPATISTAIQIFGRGFDNGATVTFTDDDGNVVAEEFFELDCGGDCGDTQILSGYSPEVEGLEDDACLTVSVTFDNGTSTEGPIVKALGTLCLAAPPQIAEVAPEAVPSATVDAEVTLTGPNLRDGSSVVATIPDGSALRFGNGVSMSDVEVTVTDVEFAELATGGELTFVRPVIEDNPLTPKFEGVREATEIALSVVDEWGQTSDDEVLVSYSTSPRILGVSPPVVPSTVPVTFVATMNNVSLDGTGAGDLSFYFFDDNTGELLAQLGDPSVELWEQLIDPNVNPDPALPTTAVRGVTPTYDGVIAEDPYQNVAVVVTNDDGQQAIYPITYSPEAEILSVRNTETGFSEVGATASSVPDYDYGKSFPSFFPVGRIVRIEGFDFRDDPNDAQYLEGEYVEVRFSMLGQDTSDDGVDEDGTLLDIVDGVVVQDAALGVQYVEVAAPALPCGTIEEDTLVQVRVTKADGQGTSEAAVGTIVYKAEPELTAIRTIPNEGATHTESEFPATIPTIFELEGEHLASAQYLGLPRPQLEFTSSVSSFGEHLATVPFTTGSVPGSTPLVGLELQSSPDPTASDLALGRTPRIVGLTEHEEVTLVFYDAYGQASVETKVEEGCGDGPLTITALAPPQIATFSGIFTNCAGEETTALNLAPGTDQVTASFEITGSLFTPGIIVRFYEDSELVDGFYEPIGDPFAELGPDDLGGNDVDTITGTVPPLLGPEDDTALNVSVVLYAQDGQQSVAYPGIKYVGLPQIDRVVVAGTDDELAEDLGDSFFITNGPFRNAYNGLEDPGFLGEPVEFMIFGRNLDCRNPVTGAAGHIEVSLTAGASATAETIHGPVLGASVPMNVAAASTDVAEGTVTFGILDQESTYDFNGVTDMRSMTDGYGYLDIELCDCTGQTNGADDVLATIQGPATAGEGNALSLTTGDVNGDSIADVATLVSAAQAYYSYLAARLNVWYGTDSDIVPIEPNYTFNMTADADNPLALTMTASFTANARNMVVGDFKNDGYGDIIVGLPDRDFTGVPLADAGSNSDVPSPGSSFGGGTEGAVAYFEGTASGIAEPSYILGDANALNGGFGTAVAAGLINNDAFEDLVIAAPGYTDTPGPNDEGRIYVFYGGPNFAQSLIFPGEDFFISPDNQSNLDYFGLGLTVGDYTNDGFDEVFAGSPGFDTFSGVQNDPYRNTGRVYQYNGGNNIDDTPENEFAGGAAEIGFAAGFPVAGDFDEDGVVDLYVGRPGLGLDLPSFTSTERENGDVLVYLGGDNSPLSDEYTLLLQDQVGDPLPFTGAGYGAGIEDIEGGDALVSGPEYFATFVDKIDLNFMEGIVQRFSATGSVPAPADINVGVDTKETYLSITAPGLYGQHVESDNFLQASEGTEDFLITLPGIGRANDEPGGGLVIVPDGVEFGK